jgi:hypothetical protein
MDDDRRVTNRFGPNALRELVQREWHAVLLCTSFRRRRYPPIGLSACAEPIAPDDPDGQAHHEKFRDNQWHNIERVWPLQPADRRASASVDCDDPPRIAAEVPDMLGERIARAMAKRTTAIATRYAQAKCKSSNPRPRGRLGVV